MKLCKKYSGSIQLLWFVNNQFTRWWRISFSPSKSNFGSKTRNALILNIPDVKSPPIENFFKPSENSSTQMMLKNFNNFKNWFFRWPMINWEGEVPQQMKVTTHRARTCVTFLDFCGRCLLWRISGRLCIGRSSSRVICTHLLGLRGSIISYSHGCMRVQAF